MRRRAPALTLLVIAKEPVPGRVKTRLARSVGPLAAAAVASAALADTLDVVAATPARRRVLVLDGRPGPWLPRGVEVVPQAAGGLDERIAAAFAAADGPAFLVGMDTPQLTPALLRDPFAGADAALGRCPDGGFWGVGLRRPGADVFRGVPMSDPTTGAVQRHRLEAAGLRVRELAPLRDVDTVADAAAVARLVPRSRFAAAVDTALAPRPSAVDLYGAALRGQPVRLVTADGRRLPFDVARWTAAADPADLSMLDRCRGVTLDVGCGPGRMAATLAARGRPVLGVDVAPSAVALTTAAGALALRRSVFDMLPGEGRWDTVLLADGNLGIGGDPGGLLGRVRELLRPGGLLLLEPEPTEVDEVVQLALQLHDPRPGGPASACSDAFPWARLGPTAATRLAEAAGYRLEESWRFSGRTFLALRRAVAPR